MRLGVLGGTFDPLHLGHLILAEYSREQLALERVLFVPAGQPWRKADRTVSAAGHRLQMARLGTADNPALEVSGVEIERPGPSYTADTLEWLLTTGPGASLTLILGQDALLDLPHWVRPRRILELATLAVARRGGSNNSEEALRALPGLEERLVWLEMPRIDISASEIRARVRRGLSIRYLVPGAVEAYIREHGLYRSEAAG